MDEMIDNKKKCEILAERISQLEYGDTILHSDIAGIILEPHFSPKYNAIVQRAKKLLLNKYSRHIESVKNVGYRITYPDDFVVASQKCVKRGVNAIKKGEKILINAPVAEMTDDGRDAYRRVHDRVLILSAAVNGASVEVKQLGKRRHLEITR